MVHTGENGKMRLRCTVLRGVHGRVGVACAAAMHGCASFARRLRAGLRPSRGGHARACVLLKAVAGGSAPTGATVSGQLRPVAHLRAGYLCTGQLCPWNLRLGTPASDGHPRPGGVCVRAAAGHTGLSPCRPHPGLHHPGAPASAVRYKQCRRRPAKHAKRRRHKARRRGGQRGNSFHSCR